MTLTPNTALNLAPFGRWTLRDKAAQRRLAPRYASQMAPRRLLLLVLLAAVSHPYAVAAVELSPKSLDRKAPGYETISFVSEGPAYGHTDGVVRGRYHRILFLNAGLAYDRPVIRLETLTYGDEVCCRRVVAAWEIDLNALQDKGVALPDAATTALRFRRWSAASSAEFRYGDLNCRLSGIGNQKVSVSCNK